MARGLGPSLGQQPLGGVDRAVEVVGGHRRGRLACGLERGAGVAHPQGERVLEGLGVVDGPLGLALGRRIGVAVGGQGRMRMVGGPADRAVVADGQRTRELGRHAGDPAFADVEQVLADVEQAADRRASGRRWQG